MAAGVIHADSERGKVRVKDEDYGIAEGDVVEFRFEVWSCVDCPVQGPAHLGW